MWISHYADWLTHIYKWINILVSRHSIVNISHIRPVISSQLHTNLYTARFVLRKKANPRNNRVTTNAVQLLHQPRHHPISFRGKSAESARVRGHRPPRLSFLFFLLLPPGATCVTGSGSLPERDRQTERERRVGWFKPIISNYKGYRKRICYDRRASERTLTPTCFPAANASGNRPFISSPTGVKAPVT